MATPKSVAREMPVFDSIEDEAEFWDTHSTTEYEDEWEPVDVEFSPDLKHLWLIEFTLDIETADQLKRIARQQGGTTSELARSWLLETLAQKRAESGDMGSS
jgi:hypothetical protein